MAPKRAASVAKPAPKSKEPVESTTSGKVTKTKATAKSATLAATNSKAQAKSAAKVKAPAKSTTSKTTKTPSVEVTNSGTNSTTSTASSNKITPAIAKSNKRKAEEVEVEVEKPTKRIKSMPAAKKTAAQVDEPTMETTVKKAVAPKNAAAKKAAIKADEQTTKNAAAPKKAAASKSKRHLPEINSAPTKTLHTFVFGEGSQGELGLGHKNAPGKMVIDVKRPRLNGILEELDVVQIAVGGMHCAVLTADNKIYTWGVNDQGALGRETKQEGKMKDLNADADDSDSDSDSEFEEDSGLNPAESEPREVDPNHFPEGTRFATLFAGDSTTFALTTTGLVYGWGTFRGNDGILGFSKDAKSKSVTATQSTPTLLPELKQVKTMAVGANHALALTHKGKAFIWGAGEQSQLGRRVVARTATGALVPREFGFQRKNIVDIAAGEYCSFAVEKNGNIYAWGHNGYGQCGVDLEKNIDDIVPNPTIIEFLKGKDIAQIDGGNHHAIARTTNGEVLVWGRLDNYEGGMKPSDMPKDSIISHEVTGKPLVAIKPLTIPNLKAEYVTSGADTCFVLTPEGKAYSWGFSTNYQTGLGTSEDVVEATLIDNGAVRDKKLVFAGAGGQFGVVASYKDEAADEPAGALTNGA